MCLSVAPTFDKVDPRVLDKMLPYMTQMYGNPHSRTHVYGWESESAIEDARKHIATLCGADAKEMVFTSGATESNNAAIKGIARFYGKRGKGKKHIITTQTEHKCVLDSCRILQLEGFEVTYLPVGQDGMVDIEQFKAALTPETCLASVMFGPGPPGAAKRPARFPTVNQFCAALLCRARRVLNGPPRRLPAPGSEQRDRRDAAHRRARRALQGQQDLLPHGRRPGTAVPRAARRRRRRIVYRMGAHQLEQPQIWRKRGLRPPARGLHKQAYHAYSYALFRRSTVLYPGSRPRWTAVQVLTGRGPRRSARSPSMSTR